MASLEVSLFFGILLLLIHLSFEKIQGFYIRNKKTLYAFSGGVFISYLILHILPAIYQVQGKLSKAVFLSILAGISLIFVLDRHTARHRIKYKIRAETREEHAVAFFVYHIIIGIAFITFSQNFLDLFLFFIPIGLFTAFSSLSIKEIYDIEGESQILKLLLAGSTFIGIILATILPVSRVLYYPLLGFVGGSILYVILKDVIKEVDRDTKSFYFIVGVALYSGIISLVWWLF